MNFLNETRRYLIYAFMDPKDRPYYIYYSDLSYGEICRKEGHKLTVTGYFDPEYIKAKEFQNQGFPFVISVLEDGIVEENDAIKKVFSWIKHYQRKNLMLMNRFYDAEGNERDDSPHKIYLAYEKHKKKLKDDAFSWQQYYEDIERYYSPKDKSKFKGAKSYRAKIWTFISPSGKKYEIFGELKEFCKKRGLRYNSVKNYVQGKWKHPTYKGWIITKRDPTDEERKKLKIIDTADVIEYTIRVKTLNNED